MFGGERELSCGRSSLVVGMGSGGSISYCYCGEEKQAFLNGVGRALLREASKAPWEGEHH